MNDTRSCLRLVAPGSPSPSRPAIATLLECPPLGPGNYVLVRRHADGAVILQLGRLASDAPSLNLALIRRRGAELGANEVHWFAAQRP